jgi:hypothetical protein
VHRVQTPVMANEPQRQLRKLCCNWTGGLRTTLHQGLVIVLSAAMIVQPGCTPIGGPTAQPGVAPSAATTTTASPQSTAVPSTLFNPEQLDAMLASIALYPDDLLVQILMASTYPLEIVEASRWLASGSNKDFKGDALAKALEPLPWDPSVKSLVPFPQVLQQMDQHLEWTQQIGYAMSSQQDDVLNSVQRLRRQAQNAGTLKTTEQQVVLAETEVDDEGATLPGQSILIRPADPQTVYVPVYDPLVIYGTWPYPAYPPIYYPAAGYYPGTGLAFVTGVAVVASLWGWAGANWGYGGGCCGSISVDRSRYNNISINNPNRGNFSGSNWRPGSGGAAGRPVRPPGGPVGGPARIQSLPANGIGRPNVQLPANAIDRANIGAGSGRGGIGAGPAQRPAIQPSQGLGGGAFGGMRDGARAGQFQQRGAQSLGMQRRGGGGFSGGGGGFRGGGRGGRR